MRMRRPPVSGSPVFLGRRRHTRTALPEGSPRARPRLLGAGGRLTVSGGCSSWKLPAALFVISRPTVHRGFHRVDQAGLWERLR